MPDQSNAQDFAQTPGTRSSAAQVNRQLTRSPLEVTQSMARASLDSQSPMSPVISHQSHLFRIREGQRYRLSDSVELVGEYLPAKSLGQFAVSPPVLRYCTPANGAFLCPLWEQSFERSPLEHGRAFHGTEQLPAMQSLDLRGTPLSRSRFPW